MLYLNKTVNTSYWLLSRMYSVHWNYFGKCQVSQECLELFFLIGSISITWKCERTKLFEQREMRLFYPWASQPFAEVRSRWETEHDRISYSTGGCSHPVTALYDTLLLLFTVTWQPFISPSPLLPPFLLHRFSVPCNSFVLLGACRGLSFDIWKKQNFQSDMMLTGSFCLPFRPISLTSSVSLHSSPAMQCFQTISMRMKSECYRPLVYKPTRETILIIPEQYFFWLIPRFMIKHKTFSSVCLLVTGGWWPRCNVLSLILTRIC